MVPMSGPSPKYTPLPDPENEAAKLFLEALRAPTDEGVAADKKSAEKSPAPKSIEKPSKASSPALKAATPPKTKPIKKINDSGGA